jgi:hypothetical protein
MGVGDSGVEDRGLTRAKVKKRVKIVDTRFEVGVQCLTVDMLHRQGP